MSSPLTERNYAQFKLRINCQMKTLKYKREWLAKERISQFLKQGRLISWYWTDHYCVVNVKRS